jgi:hypothetical protein
MTMDAAVSGADHLGAQPDPTDPCDICNSSRTVWRKCKLVCLDCGSIVKSCADL